ncbi:rCG44405 [Rattus norvegicus]|uniref:RCG44405 n=1 Tax=Rattus norvegicus TaxID=10116 RepID=A6I4U2_RAT|nr:rCG44405 [Rattus norvegicus]
MNIRTFMWISLYITDGILINIKL